MTDSEYVRRQEEACAELRRLGLLRKARTWIRKNRPPESWTGTPMEYALEEMPVGWWSDFFGA